MHAEATKIIWSFQRASKFLAVSIWIPSTPEDYSRSLASLLSSCTTIPYKARIIMKRQSINHGKSWARFMASFTASLGPELLLIHGNMDGLLKKSSTVACFKDCLANGKDQSCWTFESVFAGNCTNYTAQESQPVHFLDEVVRAYWSLDTKSKCWQKVENTFRWLFRCLRAFVQVGVKVDGKLPKERLQYSKQAPIG